MHSMTFMILLVFLMLLAFYTPAESLHFFKTSDEECPTMQEIPSCDSILASKFKAYIYQVPQNISTNHCEHGWYYQNGTFIVDSTPDGNGKKFEFVMDVTPQNLTVSACMNLQWQIHCEHIQYICAINYTGPSLGIGLTVICIILGIVGLTVCSICYCRQNPRNRTDYVAAKQNGVEL